LAKQSPLRSSCRPGGFEFAMGLRPTHGDESALPRLIDSKWGCHPTFDGVKWLVTFYKKNVKENISPTTGYRPDIQPLYVSTRLWFPSLVALVGRTKACGGSEFLWRSHRRLTTKPVRSETNKHNGCQMPTMILSGTQGPSLFRIVREGLGSTRRLGAEAHCVYVTS
jgi:hypothetical protein